MVEDRQQATLDVGFLLISIYQQRTPVIDGKMMCFGGFEPALLSFTVWDVITELSPVR